MDTSVSIRIFLLLILQPPASISRYYHDLRVPRKCCPLNQQFNKDLICTLLENNREKTAENQVKTPFKCEFNDSPIIDSIYNTSGNTSSQIYTPVNLPGDFCLENTTNSTKILIKCPARSLIFDLGAVVFWGAQTYMSTNIAHVILCIVVVLIYLSVPALGRGLYNRAVFRHNICLMMHGVILQVLGFCELMKKCYFNDYLMVLSWLGLQYFTIATVFWLNVICFDMTLAITRFRRIRPSKSPTKDSKKLLIYGIFAWGGSLLPTLLAGLCDFIPGVSKDFLLKPSYLNFRNGPSSVVNMYFFALPAVTLLLNNVLFVFTTFKIIRIQRSTEIATRNQTNLLKKKYFLFLRLYLLMGAPWFFGMLLACLNKLMVLKVCRLVQPSLWLLILITQKEVIIRVKKIFLRYKRPSSSAIATISS